MQKSKILLCWKMIVLVAYMTGKIVLDFFKVKSLLRYSRSKLLPVLQVPVTRYNGCGVAWHHRKETPR